MTVSILGSMIIFSDSILHPEVSQVYMPDMPQSKESPAKKIKRLERELEDLRLKNIIKDEMINIMDEEYGAGLRKKYISELSRAQKKTEI